MSNSTYRLKTDEPKELCFYAQLRKWGTTEQSPKATEHNILIYFCSDSMFFTSHVHSDNMNMGCVTTQSDLCMCFYSLHADQVWGVESSDCGLFYSVFWFSKWKGTHVNRNVCQGGGAGACLSCIFACYTKYMYNLSKIKGFVCVLLKSSGIFAGITTF